MSHNTLLHRLIRPTVRALTATGITPNQLTALRLGTGLLAAAAFAEGGALWPDLGAASMLASLLLDRADGELARATGRTSTVGYRYDLVADGLSTIAVFLGMGLGARATWGPVSLLYGAVAAVSVLLLFILMQVVEPRREGTVIRPFDPDDALLFAPLLIWAGLMAWTVLVAAVVSPLVAAVLAGLAWRGKVRAAAAQARSPG